jgi:hypothetical protein
VVISSSHCRRLPKPAAASTFWSRGGPSDAEALTRDLAGGRFRPGLPAPGDFAAWSRGGPSDGEALTRDLAGGRFRPGLPAPGDFAAESGLPTPAPDDLVKEDGLRPPSGFGFAPVEGRFLRFEGFSYLARVIMSPFFRGRTGFHLKPRTI